MPSTDPSAVDGPVDAPPPDAAQPERAGGSRDFPRDARLLNGRAYDAVFGDNRRVADRLWTVLAHRVPEGADPSARLGLAIAKKRARRAVDRNRIKRVARESFRHARDALAGHHVVVMNRDAATGASAAELRAALDTLWARLQRPPGADERRSGARRDGARASGKRPGSARRVAEPASAEPSRGRSDGGHAR